MSPPRASTGSGHGWTPIPRLPLPSLGFIPGLTAAVSLSTGMLWSWVGVSPPCVTSLWGGSCPLPLHPPRWAPSSQLRFLLIILTLLAPREGG